MTSPVSGISLVGSAQPTFPAAAATDPSASTTASNGLQLNPQAFLQLLVAQLQYQDPSNPVDSSTFMNQTAMLSQVQTMNGMAATLTALVGAQQAQSATDLLGRTVSYVDGSGTEQTGTVSSVALASTGPTLTIGSATVPLTSVKNVAMPTST